MFKKLFSGEGIGGMLQGAGTGFMVGGPWGAAIGAGAGGLMGANAAREAQKKEDADRALAAETQRMSPWTGLTAGPIRHRDQSKALMAGALGGAQSYAMGKMGAANEEMKALQKENLAAQNKLLGAQAQYFTRPETSGLMSQALTQAAPPQKPAFKGAGATGSWALPDMGDAVSQNTWLLSDTLAPHMPAGEISPLANMPLYNYEPTGIQGVAPRRAAPTQAPTRGFNPYTALGMTRSY